MHLRLLNAFAKAAQELNLPKEHELSAHQLHLDLFLSGIERIILVINLHGRCSFAELMIPLARSHAKPRRRTTPRCTLKLLATSTWQVWRGTSCRGRCRVSSVLPLPHWPVRPNRRLSPRSLPGLRQHLRSRPLGAQKH